MSPGVKSTIAVPLRPGPAAVCPGTVVHRRTGPQAHSFTYPVEYVWFDPDRPCDLTDHHRLWSSDRPNLVRFRRGDYGPAGDDRALSGIVAAQAAVALDGHRPTGPIRTLTQLRRLGWLFNPITIHLLWDDPAGGPVAAVLEVTNTPWKERRSYPLSLQSGPSGPLEATFAKGLHVSPFLGMNYGYHLTVRGDADRLAIDIDVHPPTAEADGQKGTETGSEAEPILHTALRLHRRSAERRELGASIRRRPLSTVAVSAGIHAQAARLVARGVRFVPHPKRMTT